MKPTLRPRALMWAAGPLLWVVTLALLLATALQDAPAVALQQELDAEDVARTLALVRQHDPRRAVPGQVVDVVLTERDLDVLLNHAAYRLLDASSRVSLDSGVATVRSSVHLPAGVFSGFGRWVNVQARLRQTAGLPVIDELQVGSLPLPAWLGRSVGLHLAQRAGVREEVRLAGQVMRHVGFMPQQMRVAYAWQGDSVDRMASALLPPAEQQRLRLYNDRMVQVVARQAEAGTVSLAPLLGPMFDLAQQRSAAGGDAVAENRAALVVLTLFANGRGVEALLPAARDWPRPRPLGVTLAGRDDFPRHLLISAALAVEGTGPLSKAIGLYKETVDARSGSGFSFNDMAANRAGTRLGEMAVAQPQRLQQALARGVQETDFMPAWADLPEFLPEAEFKRRFGGVGQAPYLALMAEIDKRVDALAVLR